MPVLAEFTGAPRTWASTGVEYAVELHSAAPAAQLERLLGVVDRVAELPRALRSGAPVTRTGPP